MEAHGPGHDHYFGEHGHHHHAHAEGNSCNHIVDARELAGPFDWRKIMAVVFSVGIRPCTGAILVLVFALTQGLFWAGVAATFAMALGTASVEHLCHWRRDDHLSVRIDHVRCLTGSGSTILGISPFRDRAAELVRFI